MPDPPTPPRTPIPVPHDEIQRMTDHLERIEDLARATNGRIREIELWQARLQGVAATSRVIWMMFGGVVTAIIIALITKGQM